MRPIYALRTQTVVGWLAGDALLNARREPCAFVRGGEVFTFARRHIGTYTRGVFRDSAGEIVGRLGGAPAVAAPGGHRRRRFQITPRLGFSVPAPRAAVTCRAWAIWDRPIDTLTA